MFSPLRLRIFSLCLLAFTSLTPISYAQNVNVTTWHNDIGRTGWQPYETILTPSSVKSGFGLLWQLPVTGAVFAQPLAVAGLQNVQNCTYPCGLVFISTEEDWLYAFNAGSGSQVWSLDLAGSTGNGNTPVDCDNLNGVDFGPCDTGVLGRYIGVTGTPVIDTSTHTLYVVATVQTPSGIVHDLFAVNIISGQVVISSQLQAVTIGGNVTGQAPAIKCKSTYPAQGIVSFDYNHIQRSALLLLGSGNSGVVYVAFAPSGGEMKNGWIFGYTYNGSAFSQTAIFNSTPYGSGGGIWGSGAGLAAETRGGSTYIYAATGNGTFDFTSPTAGPDIGDSLLKFNASNLTVADYYAASDNLNYSGQKGTGRCINDEDFGSGGVLVFPDAFYNSLNLLVNADKESNLYVTNRDNMGHFNPSSGNNIQTILTPTTTQGQKLDPDQGYWASPAYWKYTDGSGPHYMLYYSATTHTTTAAPYPLNAYQLVTSGSSGPIPTTPPLSTTALFCVNSPTPSVSSNSTGAGTGIVWAIEATYANSLGNCTGNAMAGVLHAFDATSLAPLYTSSGLKATKYDGASPFLPPTIFNGQVYMGTTGGKVNVFGPCTTQCLP